MEERPRRALLACHAATPWPSIEPLLAARGFEVVVTRDVVATAAALEEGRFDLVILQPLAGGAAHFELDAVVAPRDDDAAHAVLLVLESGEEGAPLLARLAAGDDFHRGDDEAGLAQRVELVLRRREQLRRLESETITDFKTGLFNDRYFYRRLLEEVERTRRHRLALALVLIDFDDFKRINDQFDHAFGNFVLAAFGRKLRASSRAIDLPARIGGDEFALLLPSTALDEAALVATRLQSTVDECRFEARGETLRISISMGIDAIHGEDHVAPDAFLRRADAALFEAKRRGKGRFVLYPELGQPEAKAKTVNG
ncbi:MAG: GGDEF domain-containing protein [Planctomycetes bacterium]|nr:GGDEF domain-containing protein [Planctomycetota bacterium]